MVTAFAILAMFSLFYLRLSYRLYLCLSMWMDEIDSIWLVWFLSESHSGIKIQNYFQMTILCDGPQGQEGIGTKSVRLSSSGY